MRDHYPLAGLKEALDGPVTPRLAFANDLRERLLDQLTAQNQDDSTIEEEAAPMAMTMQRTRFQVLMPTLFRLAAVFLIVTAFAGAHRVGWWGGEPEHGTIQAPFFPVEFGSPNPEWQTDPLWRSIPDGEPLPLDRDGPYVQDAIAVDGERVFRLVVTDAFTGVAAIDAETGEPLWEQAVSIGETALLDAEAGTVFVLSERTAGAVLTAFDAETGEFRWSRETSSEITTLLAWRDTLLLWDGRAVLTARSATTGDPIGARDFSANDNSNEAVANSERMNPIALAGDTLVIGTATGMIAAVPANAFDSADPVWNQEIAGSVVRFTVSGAVVAVYYRLADADDETGDALYAIRVFDVDTGESLWETGAKSTIEAPFAMGDALGYYTGNTPLIPLPPDAVAFDTLEIVEARTGNSLTSIEGIVPVVSLPDGRGLIGAGEGAEGMIDILAVSSDDPAGAWGQTIEVLSFGPATSVAVDEHRLYYVDEDYSLIAYNLSELGIP